MKINCPSVSPSHEPDKLSEHKVQKLLSQIFHQYPLNLEKQSQRPFDFLQEELILEQIFTSINTNIFG